MSRDRPPTVKSESGAMNGESCTPNSGPGSVPPRNLSRSQAVLGHVGPGQGEADMSELFSPVSETSAAGPPPVPSSVFDDVPSGGIQGGRMSTPADIPMSPFSASAGAPPNIGPPPHGHMMMPGVPPGCGPGQPYSQMQMQQQSSMGPGGPMPPGMQHPGGPMIGCPPGHGKVYPPNQPMVFNPANPNAPPIYPCGVCHKEIHDSDQAILCESGCNFWFHRTCTGLTDCAYVLLTKEIYAEWVCDNCLNSRSIPLVKLKP